MRVLFVSDVYTVGGAAKALGELVINLKNRGIESVVCTSVRDEFNEFLDINSVKNIADGHLGVMDVALPKSFSRPVMYEKLKRRYKKSVLNAFEILKKQIDFNNIDIIHTNSARNDLGCLIHKEYSIPHVMHLREFGEEDFSCWTYRRNYYKYLNRHCDILLAVSNAVRDSWIGKGVSSEKCRTLYDGVDFSKFVVKDKNTFSKEKLKIIMVGGICETKGQHIAVEALNLLPEKIKSNIFIDFAGWYDPPYMPYLKEMIKKFGLEKQVGFIGDRKDIAEILCKYDIGLMCSKSEGFGRVTAEYMYSGLGIIAADTGASPELIMSNYSGVIYNRNDAKKLADKILMYYNDRRLLIEYGTNAHIEAEKRFTSLRNADDICEVYNELLNFQRGNG